MRSRIILGALLLIYALPLFPESAVALAKEPDPVVVATFDTGTNPFHPCFRRKGSTKRSLRREIPNYPKNARRLRLEFRTDYEGSLEASRPALDAIEGGTLYYVPRTNLSFYGLGPEAKTHFVDERTHGSQASSQIGCRPFGMGANSHLVILNWYEGFSRAEDLVEWVAAQSWIDVVHLNIQETLPVPVVDSLLLPWNLDRLIDTGKMVIIAAGNGIDNLVSYPMEWSRWNGPPGSLIAGANDNGGWLAYGNLHPHIVMDGGGTVAAAPDGFVKRRSVEPQARAPSSLDTLHGSSDSFGANTATPGRACSRFQMDRLGPIAGP